MTEKEEQGAGVWRERRHQVSNQAAQQLWSVTPSCTRLYTLEEYILELERVELRRESIRNLLQEQAERKKELIKKISDLTQTQLQEQLTQTLARAQNQLRNPKSELLKATHSRPSLYCC